MHERDEIKIHPLDYDRGWDWGRVRAWFCNLDNASYDDDDPFLSPNEISRAKRLRNLTDRRRFLARCTFVRRTLAHLTGLDDASLQFGQDSRGRPQIVPPSKLESQPSAIPNFNLSHSENILGLVVCFDGAVGIDLELVRPGLDFLRLGTETLRGEDLDSLLNASPEDRTILFYRLWTQNEAVSKMRGLGIASAREEHSSKSRSELFQFVFEVAGNRAVGAIAVETVDRQALGPKNIRVQDQRISSIDSVHIVDVHVN